MKESNASTNYNIYKMQPLEWLLYLLLAALFILLLGYIFYHSVLFSAFLLPIAFFFPKVRRKQIIVKRKKTLLLQFKDMLYSLSSAVGAGSSVELALQDVYEDMIRQYYDPDTFIINEVNLMLSKIELGQNIEDVFTDFGNRSGLEDVKTFANIFEISKRTGGNLIEIIRQTSSVISEKIEIKAEMDTLLSGKKMEQRVLTIIPIALVWVMTETTGGFMDVIFTTLVGRVVSTIAVVIIFVGYIWSDRITNIRI